jgi:hypothetical protein
LKDLYTQLYKKGQRKTLGNIVMDADRYIYIDDIQADIEYEKSQGFADIHRHNGLNDSDWIAPEYCQKGNNFR